MESIKKEGVLGFTQKGEDLVRFNIVDGNVDLSSKYVIKDINTDKLSYFSNDGKIDIIFGSAFFENTENAGALNPDGYIYNWHNSDGLNTSNNARNVFPILLYVDIELCEIINN